MARRYPDPEAPEVLEAVLQRIRGMTRDEWLQELAWRPEGVEETWRMQRVSDRERSDPERPEIAAPLPLDTATDNGATAEPEALLASPKSVQR